MVTESVTENKRINDLYFDLFGVLVNLFNECFVFIEDKLTL